MRKLLLVAGLAAAALIPSLALAQPSCEQQRDNRVVGTLAGAGIGALLGSAVAGEDNRTAGAVVGGIGGAVVGNQLSKPNEDCAHAYGYYDRNSQWHANNIDRASAVGYYDRDNNWVDGAPNGYYDEGGRWVSANQDVSTDGYYDSRNRWVPASANGYYDDNGDWVTSASGYYDQDSRWIAGQTAGAYDAYGHWMPGARSGHSDVNGVWVADAQLGYYDANHRWRAGTTTGFYDTRGVWISTARSAVSYGSDASFESRRDRMGMPLDLDARENWLQQRIRSAADDGRLNHYEARRDLGELNSIRRQERAMRFGDGQLSRRDEATLQQRLDRLSADARVARDARAGF
jgi:hypothetical protein